MSNFLVNAFNQNLATLSTSFIFCQIFSSYIKIQNEYEVFGLKSLLNNSLIVSHKKLL